nr:phage integrase N-terminal SAM-like domain-containing protein [Acetoanaerobium pronyense]
MAEDFIKKGRVKGYADATIQKYTEIFHYFTKFYDEDNPVSKIGEKTIDEYILFERSRGIKDSTINIRLASLNTLFRFGYARGQM